MRDPDNAVELTRALVRIPSENPNGREAEVAAFVERWFSDLQNVETEVIEVLPGRPNVVARLRGDSDANPLALLAHMDTVPVGTGWTREPFGAELAEGNLFGRGSADMKGGLAIAMMALANASALGRPPRRDLIVCATMDEEGTHMRGVNDLVDRGILSEDAWVIATEPSDLKVSVAHKGLVWIEVKIHGKPAHAGNPQFGADAIRAAAELILDLNAQILALPYDHAELGRLTATFSRIEGGTKTNVVPESARLEIDIRLPPPMTLSEVSAMLARSMAAAEARVPGTRISWRQINNDRPPVEADRSHLFVEALAAAVRDVTGSNDVFSSFPAYTDASVVQARTGNRTCLVFGPGLLAQAHTLDEYVPVEQIDKGLKILDGLILNVCFDQAPSLASP